MTKPAIVVEHLSKKYFICHEMQSVYSTLVETLSVHAKKIYKDLKSKVLKRDILPSASKLEEFWALQDVSLKIYQGEKIGIIGSNGAGKSTLLKILCRIVHPTHGMVKIKGKIASLLEVGTGFHQELTGRENIFMNGSILGMKRCEILRKFDEIVQFSGVARFLDTPVKRYSSGMYTRLGFAIAAHMEPDILIVDEVLSVGDAEFQMKCMNKLKELSTEGRTVIFVSHDLNSILSLCDRAFYLSKGKLVMDGPPKECVEAYLDYYAESPYGWRGLEEDTYFKLEKISLRYHDRTSLAFKIGEDIILDLEGVVKEVRRDFSLEIYLCHSHGHVIAYQALKGDQEILAQGHRKISFNFGSSQLYPGEYYLRVHTNIGAKVTKQHVSLKLVLTSEVHSFQSSVCRLAGNWVVS